MATTDPTPVTGWVEPSFESSNDGTHCAQLQAHDDGTVKLRSSLAPEHTIRLNRGEFDALRQAIKAGEYDHF